MPRAARGFSLIELMIAVAIIGILAAIAVPNFLRFQARTRQSEAKTSLKAFYVIARALVGDNDIYSCGFCGWTMEEQNRYTYRVTPSLSITGSHGCTEGEGGVVPAAQGKGFTASAVANVDTDSACDGWNINDANRLWNPQNDADN